MIGAVHVAPTPRARNSVQVAARAALRHTGALEWDRLVDDVTAHTGIRLHGDRTELAALLGVQVEQDVAWLREAPALQLRNALVIIAGAYEWVTVDDLAVALARTRAGARAGAHHWPPTAPSLLAWLPTLPGWSVQLEAGIWRAVPADPPPALIARDTALADALRVDLNSREQLLAALTRMGYPPSTASVHLSRTPLLLRLRDAQPLTGRLRAPHH